MADRENHKAIGTFCKFCGSSRITQVEYMSESSYGGVGNHMIQGIQGQVAGFGGGINMGIRSRTTVYRPTWYCETCKKIDCSDTRMPIEAKSNDGQFSYKFIIPSALQEALISFNINVTSLIGSLEDLSRKLKRTIPKFLKSGTNPCKSGNIGFKKGILISAMSIDVWILMENFQGQLLARIVYGGGKSQCQ